MISAERLQHPSSLWLASASEPLAAQPALEGEQRASVAIIGGGLTGFSTALHLAERGIDVALLEANAVGWGGSGRNGGQVLPGVKLDPDELESALGAERGRRYVQAVGSAPDLVFDLIARHGIDCSPVRGGWIQAAHSNATLDAVKRRAEQWARRGAAVDILSKSEIASRIGSDAYCGGTLDRRAGTVQPLSYTRGLARAAMSAGARIFEGSPVSELRRSGGQWQVRSKSGNLACDHVVIGTDGYTDGLWPGLERTVLTVQSIQIATEPLADDLAAAILRRGECVSETRKLAYYFRRSPDGRLLFGGRGPVGLGEPETMYATLAAIVAERFPRVASGRFPYRWSGRVAFTIDSLPHLHEPAANLHLALGYNGRGIALATAMGRMLADRVTKPEVESPIPIVPVSPLPWHAMRQPLLAAAIAFYRVKDRLGLAS